MTKMFAVIDIDFDSNIRQGIIPDPDEVDIEAVTIIITDLKDNYVKQIIPLSLIHKAKDLLENNVVVSYCYDFESSFLKKYKIYPHKYIDLNIELGIGTLKRTCSTFGVSFDQKEICNTLYLLFKVAESRNRKMRIMTQ